MLGDWVAIFVIVTGAAFVIAARQHNPGFTAMMTVYGLVLSLATALSLDDSRPFGDWASPYLMDSDGSGYFEQARLLAEHGIENFQAVIRSNYVGYQILLALLFDLFGSSLLVGLIANDLLLLLSIACLYRATFLLTATPRAASLASAAFMLTPAHIFYALVLLKEPALGLAFALTLLAVTKAVQDRSFAIGSTLYLFIALLLIVTMRASLLLFMLVLIAFVGRLLVKRRAHVLAAFVAMILLIVPFAQSFTLYELDAAYFTATIVENNVVASRFEDGDLDLGGVAGRIIGVYLGLPFPLKVVLFPIPLVVQVLLPFDFWNSSFIDEHFASLFSRNLNPLWYMFVAVWVAFALFKVRQIETPLIRRFLLAGFFYYAAVSVVYSGLIPRYGVPALLFVYPAVGYWWSRSRDDPEARLWVRRFFGHYYVGAIGAAFAFLAFQFMR